MITLCPPCGPFHTAGLADREASTRHKHECGPVIEFVISGSQGQFDDSQPWPAPSRFKPASKPRSFLRAYESTPEGPICEN